MKKIIFIFLIAIAIGAIVGFGINDLQKTTFVYKQQLIANIEQATSPNNKVITPAQQPEIAATSALLAEITGDSQPKIIFAKNQTQKEPIASLTKMMTAVIAAEFYEKNQTIIINKQAIDQLDASGNLKAGEQFNLSDLLRIMLIESSNDAAFALTAPMDGPAGFVALMNLKAKDLGMESTTFFSPNGLDPEDSGLSEEQINQSTAFDLTRLAQYIFYHHPEITKILSEKETAVYSQGGEFYHPLTNTNELLGKFPSIIGGKTGTTERAGGCLLLILQGKNPQSHFVAVVLNSPDKFKDMENIITAYGF
ncbi:MAG: serine hydrolase [Candidatus Gribaldobacteria bacterium]|nr:serine hydrolase [Candidatus Gribaldobacteria bacterium]